MTWDASESLPHCWLGLALPYLDCLDQAVDPKSQILNTYKSDTSQTRIIQIAQWTHTTIYILIPNHILIGELNGPADSG
jgi:hypothetical protein